MTSRTSPPLCRLLLVALLAALATVAAPSALPHSASSAAAAATDPAVDGMFLMSAYTMRGFSSEDDVSEATWFHMPWS